jgi:hypothetical protein
MLPLCIPQTLAYSRAIFTAVTRHRNQLGLSGQALIGATLLFAALPFPYGFCLEKPELLTAGWATSLSITFAQLFLIQGWLLERTIRRLTTQEQEVTNQCTGKARCDIRVG